MPATKSSTVDADDPRERVLAVIRRIPRGSVCSYGEVARLAGLPRRARFVGTVLKTTSDRSVPWQRVVNSQGRSAFPLGSDPYRRQMALLKKEGVAAEKGRLDMQQYGWPRTDASLDRLLWELPER